MANFPPITSPCPLRWRALPEPGRDYCTFCERRVHNLDRLSEAERSALLASRSGSVCVAYTVQRAAISVIAGAGIAATLAAVPAQAELAELEKIVVRGERTVTGICDVCFSIGGVSDLETPRIIDPEKFQREIAGRGAAFVASPNKPRRRAR